MSESTASALHLQLCPCKCHSKCSSLIAESTSACNSLACACAALICAAVHHAASTACATQGAATCLGSVMPTRAPSYMSIW